MRCRRDKSRWCGAGWKNSIYDLKTSGTPKPKPSNPNHIGCYKDAGNRDLTAHLGSSMSPSECLSIAKRKGFKYFGLQNHGCFAGNKYGKYGKRPQSECKTRCKRDSSRTCGGGWRNEVFRLKTMKKPGYVSIYGEKPIGCYKDTGSRDLPKLFRAGYGQPKKCFKLVMDAGLKYAGM
jgi:hypothetical protein